jgi:membrane protease YdiL (CAAX protease family)
MWVFLFFLLLTAITALSRPGLIRRHPLKGRLLTNVQNLVWQRAIAFALMVPILIILVRHFPEWGWITSSAAWGILLIVLIVPAIAFLLTRQDKSDLHRVLYDGLQDDKSQWVVYLLITCLYMMAYELILRGIILHFLISKFEVIYAVAINVLIYATMHLAKNRREALLCIPLGTLLCWMTIYTKSVWPAAVFHTVMALSFEFFYSRKKKHVD